MAGGGPSSVVQTSKVELSPEQRQIFDLAVPYAKTYAEQPISQYSGTGIAPFSPLETQAQQQVVNQAVPTTQALAGQATTTQQKLLDPNFQLDVAHNPYVTGAGQALVDQTTRNLQEKILPGIRQQDQQAGGMYSGGATRGGVAQGLAVGQTNTGLGEDLAKMYLGAYGQGLGSLQSAVSANPSVMSQQTVAPQLEASVGGQDRAMQQAQLDETIRNFYTQQSLPFLQASDLIGLVNGMPGATNVSQATGATPGNPMAALGLGMSALGALGGTGGALGGAAAALPFK